MFFGRGWFGGDFEADGCVYVQAAGEDTAENFSWISDKKGVGAGTNEGNLVAACGREE